MYETMLNNEYKDLLKQNKEKATEVINNYKLQINYTMSENQYNKYLGNFKNIIVTHTVSIDNIEISDAIFYDDKTLYLMHNKKRFDGEGVRDLTNQILTAAD